MAIAVSDFQTLDPRHPFSRADARAAGLPLHELLGPRYQKILYDSYVLASVSVTTRLRTEAALRVSGPGAYASHFTAAVLWGGVVPEVTEIHITLPDDRHRCRRQGVRAHAGETRPCPMAHRGMAVSSPLQTFLDLAAVGLPLVDLVVLGDSLVKACRITTDQLMEGAETWSGRGARRARRAAGWVRVGVDSPMETRVRMLLVLAGLPEPLVNYVVRHADGEWRMRFDLYYDGQRLLVEFDGRQHAENAAQWQHDLKRREELDALGFRIIVITAHDLYADPEGVLRRVRDALIDRGATDIRRSFKPEWRRHFATRS
ncbi:MAG TPA: DUF559 domain-containing protein [Propionibacteriaceae bacterium]